MRRMVYAAVLAAAVATIQLPASAAEGPDAAERKLIAAAEDKGSLRVIVRVEKHSDKQVVVDELKDEKAKINYVYRPFPMLAVDVDEEALEELARDPNVVSIQEDKEGAPSLASSIPWIRANQVQQLGFDGGGQTVAILDTGIDRDHPFFNGRIVSEACYSTISNPMTQARLCPNGTSSQIGAGAADAETAQCLNGTTNICTHGSHVAGIAAGSSAGVTGAPGNGVAPGANIIAIQIYHRNNTGCNGSPPCVRFNFADFIAGMARVHDLRNTFSIAAANLSGGSADNNTSNCDTSSTKASIDTLLADGIATTVSSMNESFNGGVGEPACVSTAVTVGATDVDAMGNEVDSPAGYSNRGPLLDLFAPGTSIDSSVPDDGWANFQGTSMAAPHVAGAYAALREAYPTATVATLLGHLRNTGVNITYPSGTGTATTPRIDLLGALQAGNTEPTISTDNASVTVNEGATATNGGAFSDPEGRPVTVTASSGTVTTSGGRWSWSLGTNDGPTQSRDVTITARDDKGETATATFALTVNNIAPAVTIDPSQVTTVDEGGLFGLNATFSDPGWADSYTSTIDWGDGTAESGSLAVTTQGPPADRGEVTGSHRYADNGVYTVSVKVSDDDGGAESKTFSVQVSNVAPVVTIDPNQVKTITEGSVLNAKATFADQGSADTHSSTIDWGTGDTGAGTLQGDEVTGSHAYGDNGSFGVGVTVTDDDGGTGSASFGVQVTNVAPTATIDESGATNINGTPTFIVNSGEPLAVNGRSTDPGSDDLTLSWNWGSSTDSTTYLVNPPDVDPASSPSVQPRDVTDGKTHTFGDACSYDVRFDARDDDGGAGSDTARVVVQGNAYLTKLAPYWHLQTRSALRLPIVDLPVETVECYLKVAQHMSKVFSEVRDVSTMAKAHDVLGIVLLNPKREFDRQALTAWLNFADGSLDLDSPVDTNLDLRMDSTFGAVMANAESIRLNPASTNAQIRQQTALLGKINTIGF